ncbi:putative ankyrin repeat protein RF_0381 [Nasonia vitripennis]|uniref:Uncharacterized protein n=1 Tax=Nasonia vitripennis TaxID=7425 RepID=A0A7M7HBI8_NASVI|nr:putative ankyrin repeat protein RF_0381 [Nasonia vitripennis]
MTNRDTRLHSAVRSYNSDLGPIKSLLEQDVSDIDVANSEGQTPLHLVLVTFNELVKSSRFPLGYMAYRWSLYDKMDLIELLLDYGADVNAVDANGDTILHLLVVQRDGFVCKKIAELLLKYGADVNVANVNGDTPLHTLIGENGRLDTSCNLELVVYLLEHGADVNAVNAKGETPLHLAVRNESFSTEKLIEYLLERGAKDEVVDVNGDTPLHVLYQQDKLCTCNHLRVFLRKCRNINSTNSKGETPLHLTVRNKKYCQLPLIKLLVDRGADVGREDALGENVYQAYCKAVSEDENRRREPMLEVLLRSDERRYMNSSLHVASLFHNVDSVHRLLRRGADVNATADFGFSPLFYALIEHEYRRDKIVEMRSVVKLLLDYGADVDHQFAHSDLLLDTGMERYGHQYAHEVCSLMELAEYGTNGMCHEDYKAVRYHFFKHVVKLLALVEMGCNEQYDHLLVSRKPREICLRLLGEEEFNVWRSRCSEELNAMSEIGIGKSKLTFLELLLASTRETAIFAKNKLSVEAFHAEKGLFPMYHAMLDAKLAKALERRKLVESAATVLSDALKFADPSDEFFSRTLAYCSNQALINIINRG